VLQELGGVCPRDGQNAVGREALQELRGPPEHLRPEWCRTGPGTGQMALDGVPDEDDVDAAADAAAGGADLAVNRNVARTPTSFGTVMCDVELRLWLLV